MLISEITPKEYVEYLKKRKYNYYVVGKEHVDLKETLRLLSSEFKAKRVLADTGRTLGNLLLEQGLVDEISLLVHPIIVGEKAYNIFGNIQQNLIVRLQKQERLEKGYIWLVYKTKN